MWSCCGRNLFLCEVSWFTTDLLSADLDLLRHQHPMMLQRVNTCKRYLISHVNWFLKYDIKENLVSVSGVEDFGKSVAVTVISGGNPCWCVHKWLKAVKSCQRVSVAYFRSHGKRRMLNKLLSGCLYFCHWKYRYSFDPTGHWYQNISNSQVKQNEPTYSIIVTSLKHSHLSHQKKPQHVFVY